MSATFASYHLQFQRLHDVVVIAGGIRRQLHWLAGARTARGPDCEPNSSALGCVQAQTETSPRKATQVLAQLRRPPTLARICRELYRPDTTTAVPCPSCELHGLPALDLLPTR